MQQANNHIYTTEDYKGMKFIQISDSHLFASEMGQLLGVNTRQSFDAVIEHVKSSQSEYDFVVVTGDISQDLTEESYLYFAKKVQELEAPVFCLPGNHDEQEVLSKVIGKQLYFSKFMDTEHWQVLFLDSQVKGKVHGQISDTDINWLDNKLSQEPGKSAIVFVHHHPVSIGCEWLDRIGIQNSRQLTDVFKRHSQVKACAFGHVHQEFEKAISGVTYRSVPSTCVQFKTQSDAFAASDEKPGYRVFQCSQNGEIKSQVVRVDEHEMLVDHRALGY